MKPTESVHWRLMQDLAALRGFIRGGVGRIPAARRVHTPPTFPWHPCACVRCTLAIAKGPWGHARTDNEITLEMQ